MNPSPDDPTHPELASFGEELRREREIRGISLKEIADATKVSKRFLEAIERNDHRTLPAPVFTRGFVREYARYLGLHAEEIVSRYNLAAAGDDRIEQSDHLDRLASLAHAPAEPNRAPIPRPRRDIPSAYSKIDASVFILALVGLSLAGLTWWAMSHRQEQIDAGRGGIVASLPRTEAAAPLVAAAAAAPSAAAAAGVPAAGLRLAIEFTGDSWIALEADGQLVLNDEVRKGERRTFDAMRELRFRTIGNAGGVGLTLNGIHLPSLGPEGKVVRDIVLDRETLNRPESAAPEDDRSTP